MEEFVIVAIGILITILLLAIAVLCFPLVRVKILKTQFSHEIEMKNLDFEHKKEWEKIISERAQKQVDDDWLKEKEQLRERVDELWNKRNDITPLDMKRVTLLYLVLTGTKEGIDTENLEKEMEKVKKSYETIEKCLNK